MIWPFFRQNCGVWKHYMAIYNTKKGVWKQGVARVNQITSLEQNLQNMLKGKDKEIEDLIQAKKAIIQSYNEHMQDFEGELKKQLKREKQESLKSIQLQTENVVK